jgi:hypothetical protein
MSQSGDLNPVSSNPQIPTTFITDNGDAIPISNELEIFGAVVANSGIPIETVGSGNTVTVNVQVADAVAATDLTAVGLAAFDSADFSVDANGFVSLVGGGSGITTINGDSGSITGAAVTIYANNAANTCGSTVKFTNSGTTSTLSVSDPITANTLFGQSSGNATITGINNTGFGLQSLLTVGAGGWNTAMGRSSLQNLSGGNLNAAFGWLSLTNCVSGSNNCAIGTQSMERATGSQNTAVGFATLTNSTTNGNVAIGYLSCYNVTGTGTTAVGWSSLQDNGTGDNNTCCGYNSLRNLNGGSNNTCLGYSTGSSYTTNETNNLLLGYNITGTLGESNVTRLGGTQTHCYVAGALITNSGRVIDTTTPGAYPYTTLISDHLILVDTSAARTINLIAAPVTGTLYIIKDSVGSAAANNITITPAAGNIDGAASATINVNYGSATLVYSGSQWSLL